ncbi:MFS transporter [Actinomycetospora termitidis]|uniref:MFS transporter n=1 Tax=Actinomycetospora termitidis TaxID=3053470 RepID=A0ABT7MDR9_9PSEU|nr:MFS transporter [Actinomycetospora sp. Odt1-22]MDL5158606.1 MFS transporter [Actinomycetospora sp. Odt1-22]
MSAPGRPRLVLAVACLAQFLVVLDVAVVNVALPRVQADLGFTSASLPWVLDAYTVAFAGFLLLGGRLADLLGHRRMLLVGLAAFGLASVAAGASGDPAALIAARAAQGLAGAVLSPATLTVLTAAFSEGPERTRALGTWSAVGALGGATGGAVGGVLVQLVGWPWVFWINAPVCAAAIVGALAGVAVRPATRRPRLDLPGALLATGALVALVLAVIGSQADEGPVLPAVAGGAAVVLGAALVAVERRAPEPLVPGHALRRPGVAPALAAMALVGAAVFAMWFHVALVLQQGLGLDPLHAGLAFLPQAAGIMLGAQLAARLVPRLGASPVLFGGAVVMTAGLLGLAGLRPDDTWASGIALPGVLVTLGMGLSVTPIATLATAGTPEGEEGLVSGLLSTARQVGAAVGLAALAAVATAAGGPGPDGVLRGATAAFLAGAALTGVAAVLALTTRSRDRDGARSDRASGS